MSALTEAVDAVHQIKTATGSFGLYEYCVCGSWVDETGGPALVEHLMEEVEIATRQVIARRIEEEPTRWSRFIERDPYAVITDVALIAKGRLN